MTAGKKAGTIRATKRNTRLTLELLETARDMHAGGALTDVGATAFSGVIPPKYGGI
jgi:putative transcriptional regulator